MGKTFSKQDSQNIKGWAILILLFHHLFDGKERFAGFDVSFAPFSRSGVLDVADLLKVCVGMFVFVTGYGLYISYNSIKEKNRFNIVKWDVVRYLKTFSGYWFVCLICMVVTQITDGRVYTTYKFAKNPIKAVYYLILDVLGIRSIFGTPTLIITWWYMGAVMTFILLIPLLTSLCKKYGFMPMILLSMAAIQMMKIKAYNGLNGFSYLVALMFGMMFAEYHLFEKIDGIFEKPNKVLKYVIAWILIALGIVICFLLCANVKKKYMAPLYYSVFPLVFVLCAHICMGRIKPLKSVAAFIGRHSLTIFLTHNFLRTIYLNDFIYSRGNFLLIYLVFAVCSIAVAVVIDFVKTLVLYDRLVSRICDKINSYSKKEAV